MSSLAESTTLEPKALSPTSRKRSTSTSSITPLEDTSQDLFTIQSIKFAFAIQFDGKTKTSITSADAKITYSPTNQCFTLVGKTSKILVPIFNVVYAAYA